MWISEEAGLGYRGLVLCPFSFSPLPHPPPHFLPPKGPKNSFKKLQKTIKTRLSANFRGTTGLGERQLLVQPPGRSMGFKVAGNRKQVASRGCEYLPQHHRPLAVNHSMPNSLQHSATFGAIVLLLQNEETEAQKANNVAEVTEVVSRGA